MEEKSKVKLNRMDELAWNLNKPFYERRSSLDYQKKKFQNQQDYARRGGGTSTMRITVPSIEARNLDAAILRFGHLVEALKQIKSSGASSVHKIGAMRSEIYYCHTSLKEDGDRPRLMPKNPSFDYRGAK